jgi:hypothetical protein
MVAAVAQGFPARISLVKNVSTMMYDLMATVRAVFLSGCVAVRPAARLLQVSTTEGFGTIFNVLAQSMVNSVGPGPSALLAQLAGQALPAAALLPKSYDPLRAPQIEVRDKARPSEAKRAF